MKTPLTPPAQSHDTSETQRRNRRELEELLERLWERAKG